MYCRNCGTQVDELDNFCPGCGKKIVKLDITVEKSSIETPESVPETTTTTTTTTEKISDAGIIKPSPMLKNAGVSATLSTFIPGLGQIYNGQILKGIPIIIISIALVVLMIAVRLPERVAVYAAYVILWMVNIFDAHRSADKINAKFK